MPSSQVELRRPAPLHGYSRTRTLRASFESVAACPLAPRAVRDTNAEHPTDFTNTVRRAGMSRDDILLRDVWYAVTGSWLLIVSVTAIVTLLATTAAFIMTPIYRATVVMTPASTEDNGFRLPASLGGLAAFAGMGRGESNKEEAIATLKSRVFTERFILSHDLLPVLFADRWVEDEQRWEIDDAPPPDAAAGYRHFKGIRSVAEDRATGIVTLSIEWHDREQAVAMANALVAMLNEELREDAIAEAERSIEFLKKEAEATALVELQQGIHRLIETQINRAMLARVREQYAFRVIDPAALMSEKELARPRRTLMIAAGFLFGLIGGCIIAILRQQFKHVSRQPQLAAGQSAGDGD